MVIKNIFASCSRTITPIFCQRSPITTSVIRERWYSLEHFYKPITSLRKNYLRRSDPRYIKHALPMASDKTPVLYRNVLVDKFIRECMIDGNKEKARELVYGALERIKCRQYKEWKQADTDEKKAKIERNPFVMFEKAIDNLKPVLRLVNSTRGGIRYQIPMPVGTNRAGWAALKNLRIICTKISKGGHRKGNKGFVDNLVDEIIGAYSNEGKTIESKQAYHKRCEANKAYANYLYRSGKR